MSAYTTVLVGSDGSESSFRAVDRAAAVTAGADATLLVVCAYHPMSDREVRDATGRARTAGAERVEALAVSAIRWTSSRRWPRTAASTWWSSATRELASLAGRLLGSVPTNISHHATCDVLIVHTTGRFQK